MKPLALLLAGALAAPAADMPRPPSVPLVTCDPYFSVWSPHDRLNDGATTHWTGKEQRLEASITIDGETRRLLGAGEAPALPQTGLELTATRTIASYEGEGVKVTLTFTTPMLPDDLDVLSRPVTYLDFDVAATDGTRHDVSLDFTAGAELATNTPDQVAEVSRVEEIEDLGVLRAGTLTQRVLARSGDDIRIDWGYFYLAAPSGDIDGMDAGAEEPGPAGDQELALRFDLGEVGAEPVNRWLMVAYDDLYSIKYMDNDLRPYWRRNGWEAADLLEASRRERTDLMERCRKFDEEFGGDLREVGGEDYAYLGALAFRQCFAAGKFVADRNGQPLQFSKENHSNGCLATADVFYPMSPQFLLFGPSLAKSFLVPFMNYAASDRWTFPFAPHDLGQYPHANGQVYGGGETSKENQMPVEECGNLLILFGAVAHMEGDADFAGKFWPQLTQWAEYLENEGYDPDNQLCTDDFAGHMAHNVNLSAKAICGLASYARLCELRGDQEAAETYAATAKRFAGRWMEEADDGDHYRLAFDQPGTWSQKYNLVWDRILDLDLFPDEVLRTEMDHYLEVQNEYGLPLDNRRDYTKLDWILWSATLTREREDFDALVKPVRRFLDETPDRAPMTDWYDTKTAGKVGFTARPVVGGVFLEMLYHDELWEKYAGREKTDASGWAPLPKSPKVTHVVPTAEEEPAEWRYTTERPGAGWESPDFDDAEWNTGESGFGTPETPSAVIGTRWDSADIWLRREITIPEGTDLEAIQLRLYHDEDAEVYLNGELATSFPGFTPRYANYDLSPSSIDSLRIGKNTIAIHCHQTTGGQYIDAGLVTVEPAEED